MHPQHFSHLPSQTEPILSQQHISQCMQQSPQMLSSTYIDPSQYLAAIPVHSPALAGAFPPTAAVISSIQVSASLRQQCVHSFLTNRPFQPLPELLHHPSIVMTSTQSHIQDQLQRKHEELQQLIVHQQEELRRVSEQLLMARYGLLPSIVNVAMPFSPISRTPSRTGSQSHGGISSTTGNPNGHQSILQMNQNQLNCNLDIGQIDSQGNIQTQNDEIMSYMELQSTSNANHLEHPMEPIHPHQRHERRLEQQSWDASSSQSIPYLQQRNAQIHINNADTEQMQRDDIDRRIPSTMPAKSDSLDILPYRRPNKKCLSIVE